MYFGFSLKSYTIQYFKLGTSGVMKYLVTYFNHIYDMRWRYYYFSEKAMNNIYNFSTYLLYCYEQVSEQTSFNNNDYYDDDNGDDDDDDGSLNKIIDDCGKCDTSYG